MLITRTSPLTGKENTREIDITQEQLERFQKHDGFIQDIMSNISSDEREFIMSGLTPEDWESLFGPEDE